jgi:hypothetical protein
MSWNEITFSCGSTCCKIIKKLCPSEMWAKRERARLRANSLSLSLSHYKLVLERVREILIILAGFLIEAP